MIASQTLSAVHVPAHTNAYHAPTLNVLGMAVGVKIQHAQTNGQLSCVETDLAPRQMGPPPHVHHRLDEVMRVTAGTITILEGDQVVEVHAGGWHFRPRGVVHTFWNAHDAPASFIDIYPSDQNFAHYLEELAQLGGQLHAEGANPMAPENLARFKALDARYDHEVFYEQMPAFLAKYSPASRLPLTSRL